MGKPSKAVRSGEDYHPWSTYIAAREEARRRGDRKVGTEHLLVALLSDPVLAGAVGSDAEHARSALDAMDHEALVAIGMDAPPEVPPLPAADPSAVPARPTIRTVLHKRLRLTPCAANVLRESSKSMRHGTPHPGPQHVLAAILELQAPDPAADLLATLGVQPAAVRERLADV
ncbi:MAG: Clp protease N-terminal domain-containing protein [Solirubrobacteraceae bacterium]